MDIYINQDILSYLDIDSRVIAKRLTQFWNSYIQVLGIKETQLKYLNDLLYIGCYDGSVRKINNGSNEWNWGFYSACFGGHIDIVKLMIENGANNWSIGLQRACEGGYMDIVKLLIDKGANDWNKGLQRACEGGHMDIVKLMIEKGANDWDYGLSFACKRGHADIVRLLIENGVNYCSHCYKSMEEHLRK